jgi:hypothetical protein
VIKDLHAILDVPQDRNRPLRLHHPSFRDFLLSRDRCSDHHFWVDESQAHWRLTEDCIQFMSKSLKQSICGARIPGTYVTDITQEQIQQCLPQELQYACLYWSQHLQRSRTQLQDHDYIHQFLANRFLHWLEALSWIQKVSEGITAIITLENISYVSMYQKNLYLSSMHLHECGL